MSDSLHDQATGEIEVGPVSYLRVALVALDRLKRYYRLLIALFLLSFVYATYYVVTVRPLYTAVATIGPPSSTLDVLTSSGVGGLGSSLAQGLGAKLGIGAAGTNPFDEYQQLLQSNRLAAKIVDDSNLMHSIFYGQYDWNAHVWKKPGGIVNGIRNLFRRILQYPIQTYPDQDSVYGFLNSSAVQIDTQLTSSYVTVSLDSDEPVKANWILNSILLKADTIVRDEKRRDVLARISYLTSVIPLVTQTDQRESLSEILSQQQQNLMTLQADSRYASTLVDPPHAPDMPTSPKLIKIFAAMIAFTLAVWGGVMYLVPETNRFLRWFETPGRSRYFEGQFAPQPGNSSSEYSRKTSYL